MKKLIKNQIQKLNYKIKKMKIKKMIHYKHQNQINKQKSKKMKSNNHQVIIIRSHKNPQLKI